MEKEKEVQNNFKQIRHLAITIFCVFMLMAGILLYLLVDPKLSAFKFNSDTGPTSEYTAIPEIDTADFDKIENGIHVQTGFVEGDGLMLVINNCTNCHSAKLVTQNRMSKEQWLATIRWMQETQNLWDLGLNEEPIVNYLATYYAPTEEGRRKNLNVTEWYELED